MIWGLGINIKLFRSHRLFVPTQTGLSFRYRLRDTNTLLNGESIDTNLIDKIIMIMRE